MIEQVIAFFEKLNLSLDNKKVVIAVSTGVDSMVLLDVFLKLRERFGLDVHVAHVNHQRRDQAKEEEKYIKTFCLRHNIKCDVLHLEANEGENFHDYAHRARYAFFDRIMKETKADYLLLGHHADDNMETVIMRIIRGSNLKGYAGIAPVVSGDVYLIARPLAAVSKAEIIKYAAAAEIRYFIDESNLSDAYTRNRIRQNIVPALRAEDADVDRKFTEFSESLAAAWEIVAERVNEVIATLVRIDAGKISFSATGFAELSEFLQYEVLFAILKGYSLSKSTVGELIKIIKSEKKNIKVFFKRMFTIVKEYGTVSIHDGEIVKPVIDLVINAPGMYRINDSMSVNVLKIKHLEMLKANEVWYNIAMLPVRVRTRKPGDRILLSAGYKKVKDLLIDKKIGILAREKLLVIEKDGEILAVPGVARSRILQQIEPKNLLIRVETNEG